MYMPSTMSTTTLKDQWGNPMTVQEWGPSGQFLGNRTNPLYGKNPNPTPSYPTAPPVSGAPVSGAPVSGAPVSGALVSGAPVSGVDASGRMNAFLDQSQPQMNQNNRFEPALNSSQQKLSDLISNPDSISQSAAYRFRVGQGQEALQRQMAAKGMLGSGNRLMELTKYGQDMGSQEYGNQFDRLNQMNQTATQGWLGDKNANVSSFGALSNQNAARGGLLSNLINSNNVAQQNANQYALGQQQNMNQAQSTANNYALGQQNVDNQQTRSVWGY